MPTPPARPDQLRGRVFRGTSAVAAGLLTADQLHSAAWRRLRRDVYVDARTTVDHRLLACGVSLVMPRTAVLGGRTAAVLWHASHLATAADPVEVVVPRASGGAPVPVSSSAAPRSTGTSCTTAGGCGGRTASGRRWT